MIVADRPNEAPQKKLRQGTSRRVDPRKARARFRSWLQLGADPRQPSQRLFGGVRRRLTLWYSSVIALALILCGTILYVAVQQSLLGPINDDLKRVGAQGAQQWQENYLSDQAPFSAFVRGCPSAVPGTGPDVLIACYGKNGDLKFRNYTAFYISSFLKSPPGANSGDLISTGQQGDFAYVQRYAEPVNVPGKTSMLGTIVVGVPVGEQGNALATLLHLLLLLGGLTILLSFAAGLFLANRALQPARVAYARQRDFIADASHELRTPLTMLRSSVEFVLRGSSHLPPDDVALLKDTVEETTHLTSLANNMLNLARLDSDDVHYDEEVIDIGHVADEVTRWARPLANEKSLALVSDVSSPALVLGDRSMLEQAVLVLVDNAIKYNVPDGSVHVSVIQSLNEVSIIVKDSGIGVAPDDLKRLGERFYRVDKARSRESGGAGLGLSIVRSIVARHRGQLRFESATGEGTTATIRLPLVGTSNIKP